VKRVTNYGTLEEDVYETAHLEILPPRQRSAAQDLSSQDADGLWRITCLNSQRSILLYNDDRHWNKKLKAEFLQSVSYLSHRNSTSGTRVTMDIIVRRRLKEMQGGEKKYLAQLIRKLFLENDLTITLID